MAGLETGTSIGAARLAKALRFDLDEAVCEIRMISHRLPAATLETFVPRGILDKIFGWHTVPDDDDEIAPRLTGDDLALSIALLERIAREIQPMSAAEVGRHDWSAVTVSAAETRTGEFIAHLLSRMLSGMRH